jgi:hypothetical protein
MAHQQHCPSSGQQVQGSSLAVRQLCSRAEEEKVVVAAAADETMMLLPDTTSELCDFATAAGRWGSKSSSK